MPPLPASDIHAAIVVIGTAVPVLLVYLLPAFLAADWRRPKRLAITVQTARLGWVGALVWALTRPAGAQEAAR